MATSNGPYQNYGRIEWVYSVPSVSRSTTSLRASVQAYFRMQSSGGWNQNYNGTKSWSGHWGSGSGNQTYNLGPGQRVQIVTGSGPSVTLTDSWQTRKFVVTARHWFGNTGSTLTVRFPPRYARTPTGLTITRNSDTSHRLNWNRNSTYSSVIVQRREASGGGWSSWTQRARVSGNAYTWTDTGTRADRRYEYRVAGVGGSGQSSWSSSAGVYTTPRTPSGLSATRLSNDDIRIDASSKPPYATSYDIQDGTTTVATSVSLPWTHSSPNPATTHRYRIRAKRGSLTSGYSSYSNTVQLQSAPLAPIGLSPNGQALPFGDDVILTWQHNPVDSSEQTRFEVQFNEPVIGWTTVADETSGEQTFNWGELPAGFPVEWRVRTKGAHPEWSPWSNVATFNVYDRPGVAINAPEGTITTALATVEWSYVQEQGRPQSRWRARLLLGDDVIEEATGQNDATSHTFEARLEDGNTYTVQVEAATGDIWSELAVGDFFVQFIPPQPASFEGEWNEETGSVDLTVNPVGEDPAPPVTNHFPNPRFVGSGEMVEVARNKFLNPRLVGSGDTVEIERNLFTNPRFVGSGEKVEIRRNLIANPNFEGGSATGYVVDRGTTGADPSIVVSTERSERGTRSLRWRPAVPAGQGALAGAGFRMRSTDTRAAGSGPVTISASINSDSNLSRFLYPPDVNIPGVTFQIVEYTPGRNPSEVGVRAETTMGSFSANEWRRFSLSATASDPANVLVGRFYFGSMAPGTSIYSDSWMYELGDTGEQLYFDGSCSPDPDFTPRWIGTANASESVLEGEKVAGVTETNCLALVSSKFAQGGGNSMRIIPTSSSSTQSFVTIPLPWDEGTQFTAMGTLSLETPQTGPLYASARSLERLGSSRATAPNLAGSHPLRYISTVGASSAQKRIRIFNGAAQGGGDIYVTNLALVEGDYSGPYFDGETAPEGFSSEWEGTPDESSSSLLAEKVATISDAPLVRNSYLSVDDPLSPGTPFMRSMLLTSGDVYIQLGDHGTINSEHTLLVHVRPVGKDQTVALRIENSASPVFETLAADVWTPLRLTVPAGTGDTTQTGVFLAASGGHEAGDVIDVTLPALVPGRYSGDYFDGDSSVDPDFEAKWEGEEDNSQSIIQGEEVAGAITNGYAIAVVSSRYATEGLNSMRIIATGDAAPFSGGVGFNIPEGARAGGIFRGMIHKEGVPTLAPNVAAAQPVTVESIGREQIGSFLFEVEYGELTSLYRAAINSGAIAGDTDTWITEPGLYPSGYVGPFFHGSSGAVEYEGHDFYAQWDGEVDNSTSTMLTAEPAVGHMIERSVDGGLTWELVHERVQLTEDLLISDFQSLSCGETIYRVTTYSASDASTVVDKVIVSDSKALWLGGGLAFSSTARLHGDPSRSLSRGRLRTTEEYAGRSIPVAYSSRRLMRELTASGTVFDIDEDGATRDDLDNVALDPMPVHLFRDFGGNRIYGSVTPVSYTDTGKTSSCGEGCLNTLWAYTFGIIESGAALPAVALVDETEPGGDPEPEPEPEPEGE